MLMAICGIKKIFLELNGNYGNTEYRFLETQMWRQKSCDLYSV